MAPGVGFGERGERAGRGEAEEGDVERESWWRDCSSSPSDSDSLILFVETLLLGVAWPFGDDMVDEGLCWLFSPHTSPGCAEHSRWRPSEGWCLRMRQDGETSALRVEKGLDVCFSFEGLTLLPWKRRTDETYARCAYVIWSIALTTRGQIKTNNTNNKKAWRGRVPRVAAAHCT